MSVEKITRIADDGTEIDVTGSRNVAAFVRSAQGERIYLPPSESDGTVETPIRGMLICEGVSHWRGGKPYREAPESAHGIVNQGVASDAT